MVMRIPVGPFPHYYTIVEDEDYEWLSVFKWSASIRNHTIYARTSVKDETGKWIDTLMHRMIIGCSRYDGVLIDHANRIGLDNRRINLRIASSSKNQRNKITKTKTSRFKGVAMVKPINGRKSIKWKASIYTPENIHLGYFDDEVNAAKAYDKAAQELFGEFARLNFPEEGLK